MRKIKDSIASIAVVAVILLIIIPLPSQVLDFLLILNLALSLTILLITTYTKRALDFSILPSLLLLTTLFRLSLEISATRLILTKDGDAGAVIKTFGAFVISGNVLVGIVVFLIIVVVQFIVITKGAERVAEVSARFTLDAMPGKQMAIDADLNTGIITEEEAKIRRRDIQREADFFGAMDGASKFVKGDAIVAIIIMVINIVGGVITGLLGGSDITAVLSTYTLATIGEGLMAQLPALLISTSTGIIVTRTASDGNMGNELSKQFTAQPVVLKTTGAVLILMMLLPGFPKLVLFTIGCIFLLLGYQAEKKAKVAVPLPDKAVARKSDMRSEVEILRNPDNVYTMLEVETIEMEFGYSLIPLVDESQGGSFVDKVALFRRQFALESGIVLPGVRMRDNVQLANSSYVIKLRGEEVAHGELLADRLLIMGQGEDAFKIDGVDTVEPAFGLPARWIAKNRREEAEVAGYTVIDPTSVMMTHLGEVIRSHAAELLGRREVNSLLDMVRKNNKTLVEEVVPGKISVGGLQKVLQNLLAEEIPIRDMVTILETIAEQSSKVKDEDLLTEYVRQSLKRTITRKFAPEGEVQALVIDPQIEKLISSSVKQSEHGVYLALEPDKAQNIIRSLSSEVEKLSQKGVAPTVIVSPGVRLYFRKLVAQIIPGLAVISYNELENTVRVQAVGSVAVSC
ncbi:MAG: flagellar biosynthesis protein FlhA [Clostridia bacterium]|nr:flagellar biosynthesis protein FlhA [Clostridia bacterium]MDR3645355.1 flagellar biosynthesis protein FlhA [Clostridia bacterium]